LEGFNPRDYFPPFFNPFKNLRGQKINGQTPSNPKGIGEWLKEFWEFKEERKERKKVG